MDAKEIWNQVVENDKLLKSCLLHSFDIDLSPDRKIGKRWKCSKCNGEVDSMAKLWYERGLMHARL